MKMLTQSRRDWIDLAGDDVEEDARAEFDARLRQLLGAEHLLVLAGLGTSLSIDAPTAAPDMAHLWERARDRAGNELWSNALEIAGWTDDFPNDIERLLSRCQMALSLRANDDIDGFVSTCEAEIVEACRFVQPDTQLPHHEAFLRRIARRPSRMPRAQVYTTNYDLAFENAASRTGFAVIDGFSHTAPQRFDTSYFDVDLAFRDRERSATAVEWMPNVLQLLKLHGSVDWEQTTDGVIRTTRPDRPLIVYPRDTKFEASYRQPFLEFMAKFQASLRRPDTAVLVVGSGWRDQHLTEPLLSAVRSNVRLSMLVVAPELVETTNPNLQTLQQVIRRGDRRLALLDCTFEDLVPELPELVPETEAEQHRIRVDAND
jgi:hypothetical protein